MVVPDLVGQSLEAAQTRASALGLKLETRYLLASAEVPQNHIISQDPRAGRTVRGGRTIWVVVSTGPEVVTVPAVEGMALREARLILNEAGLRVGRVEERYAPEISPGQVLEQNPPAEAEVEAGQLVDLVVSRAAPG